MAAEIVIEDLAQGRALLGLSLTVAPGERVAIYPGADLAPLLAGLRRPGRGTVRAEGGLALAATRPALFDRLTCREQLAAVAALHRRPPPDLLPALGLAVLADVREDRLDPSARRRLGLACALVAEPGGLVLDRGPGELWPLLADLPHPVLFTTEEETEAVRADRVALLAHGRLLAVEDPAALIGSLNAERRLLAPASPEATLADVLRHLGGREALP